MAGSGPAAKHLRAESPDHSEGNSENGNMLEQEAIDQPPPKIAVAWYPTKVIMHLEPVKTGDAKKEMPLVQMAAKVMEETELISMKESVVWEAWHGWEESLRMANRMQRVGAVALWD